MSETLYNDYKNNCYEYMKTVLYTEKIIKDNNSDQNKLLNIYEKAIKSAESMFKKMQLEVETNYMTEDKENELNNIYNEICEYKVKLKKFKEEILENDKRKYERTSNNYNNNMNYDDRILLLSDVDLLEKGDVYINHSKILMDNTEYISNDVMNNLNKQREYLLLENEKLKQIQSKQNINHTLNKFNNTQETKSLFYDFEQQKDKDTNNNKNQNKQGNINDYQNYLYKINMNQKYTDENINTNSDEYNTLIDFNEIDTNNNKNQVTQLDTYYEHTHELNKNEKEPEEKQKDNDHIIENGIENTDENMTSFSISSNINEYPTKNNNNY